MASSKPEWPNAGKVEIRIEKICKSVRIRHDENLLERRKGASTSSNNYLKTKTCVP